MSTSNLRSVHLIFGLSALITSAMSFLIIPEVDSGEIFLTFVPPVAAYAINAILPLNSLPSFILSLSIFWPSMMLEMSKATAQLIVIYMELGILPMFMYAAGGKDIV